MTVIKVLGFSSIIYESRKQIYTLQMDGRDLQLHEN